MRSIAAGRPGGLLGDEGAAEPVPLDRWAAMCPNWAGKFWWTNRTCMAVVSPFINGQGSSVGT